MYIICINHVKEISISISSATTQSPLCGGTLSSLVAILKYTVCCEMLGSSKLRSFSTFFHMSNTAYVLDQFDTGIWM